MIKDDKIQPQAIDIEEGLIGALILDKNAIYDVVNIISSECFYKDKHKIIYESILDIEKEKNNPIDLLTIVEKLKQKQQLDNIGGQIYLKQLTQKVASSNHAEEWAKIIFQKYISREYIRICNEISNFCYDSNKDIDDVMSFADKEFNNIYSKIEAIISGNKDLQYIILQARKQLEKRVNNFENNILNGITTGFFDLNKKTNGWQNGDVIILAGRPAMGKTAFGLKEGLEAAKSGVSVVFFALEMSDIRLVDRLILMIAEICPIKYRMGKMNESDWLEFDKAELILRELPIIIDDNPFMTALYIRRKAKILNRNKKCDFVIIDYLQLAKIENKNSNRERDIAEMSALLKSTAKELNVPFLILCQLNRIVESTSHKRPSLSHLRESGAIEQDADIVVMIYRPEQYGFTEDEEGESLVNVIELIFVKYREGSLGSVFIKRNDTFSKFYDIDKSNQFPKQEF